jgi:hypothetical protein
MEWRERMSTIQLTFLLTGLIGLGLAAFCLLFPSKALTIMKSQRSAGNASYDAAGRPRPATEGYATSAGKVVLTGVGALLIGIAALVVAFTVAAGR